MVNQYKNWIQQCIYLLQVFIFLLCKFSTFQSRYGINIQNVLLSSTGRKTGSAFFRFSAVSFRELLFKILLFASVENSVLTCILLFSKIHFPSIKKKYKGKQTKVFTLFFVGRCDLFLSRYNLFRSSFQLPVQHGECVSVTVAGEKTKINAYSSVTRRLLVYFRRYKHIANTMCKEWILHITLGDWKINLGLMLTASRLTVLGMCSVWCSWRCRC